MGKIVTLRKVISISKKLKGTDKKTGLIVGAFDILHMGHINLFRLAKKYSDVVIIGLDNDKTVKLTKGPSRPINDIKRRSQFLSELESVDYIFPITEVFKHADKKSFAYFKRIVKQLKPDFIFSSIKCDNLWKEKKDLTKLIGAKFIAEKSLVTHTSNILNIIESEL